MARSSRGEDARFSFWKQGFDSPTGYEAASFRSGFFIFFCKRRFILDIWKS